MTIFDGLKCMRRFTHLAIFSLMFIGVLSTKAQAQQVSLPFPATYMDEGDVFYMQKDYYRAMTRYRLYLMHAPMAPHRDELKLKMAWMYNEADKHAASASLLRDVIITRPTKDRLGLWTRLYYAQVALEAKQARLAKQAYERILSECSNAQGMSSNAQPAGRHFEAVNKEDCLELTTLARVGLARHFSKLHMFNKAVGQLRAIDKASLTYKDAQRIGDYVNKLEIPSKSPTLAGFLSIVPGLGHFYIEEYSTGVVAMIWNGAFIYALVDSIIDGKYGQASLIGLVELIWYSGTIFGAISGAHRFNRDARRIVEEGMGNDLDTLDDAQSWPGRFPVERGPSFQLELNLSF